MIGDAELHRVRAHRDIGEELLRHGEAWDRPIGEAGEARSVRPEIRMQIFRADAPVLRQSPFEAGARRPAAVNAALTAMLKPEGKSSWRPATSLGAMGASGTSGPNQPDASASPRDDMNCACP